jgi:serine/threonine protein kinase
MVLGQGAYGKVFKVEHKRTRQIFALKAISKEMIIEGDDVDIILREKNILALADKASIVCYLIFS